MSTSGLGRGGFLEVLLVDDDELDLLLFTTAARKADINMHVHTASSAQQAMDYLQGKGVYGNRELNPMPDVVVLDLVMPGMSGAELLAWRKRYRKFVKLPVVILSGANDEKQTREALALGAKAFLAKPASFEGWKEVFHTVWNVAFANKLPAARHTRSRGSRPRRMLRPRKIAAH